MQALALPDPAIRQGQSQSLFAHAAAPDAVAVCAFAIRGAFFCMEICKSLSAEYISHLYVNGAKMFSSRFSRFVISIVNFDTGTGPCGAR